MLIIMWEEWLTMADKYHNAWIIRQIVTAYRITMAEIVAYRFMTCNQKKLMLNSIYGYMAGGGRDGL
jgi:hypothetical protein